MGIQVATDSSRRRVSICVAGTRGDAESLVALGAGLTAGGFTVTVATHEVFRPLVEQRGLAFVPLPGDPRAMLSHPALERPARFGGRDRFTRARLLREVVDFLLDQIGEEDYARACAGADIVVFTPPTSVARRVAEELAIPAVLADYFPAHRTAAFPHPALASGLHFGRLGNLLSYPLAERVLREPFREPLTPGGRREVGLPARFVPASTARWPPFPVLLGFSPSLVPRPADWGPQLHVTGAWLPASSEERPLSPEVEKFLGAGPPPLYVGFGSMRPLRPERFARAILGGLELAGERAIVGAGWGGLQGAGGSADLLVVDDVPFDLIFPRVKAVVHHGGAGTTHLGLRAGRPTFVVPFIFDQFFWGSRIAALEAGPPPLAHTHVTPRRVATALRALVSRRAATAAERLGAALREEDGPRVAAQRLSALVPLRREEARSGRMRR